MKNLSILSLCLFLSLVTVQSCVSVNPATSAFSVTADILEIWIDGVPYLTIDENQHYRNLVKKADPAQNFFFIRPSDKKIDKRNVYEIVSTEAANSTALSPSESGQQNIKVYLSQADYYQRPWRK